MIKSKLIVIEQYLNKIEAPVIKYLNHGAKYIEITSFFKRTFPEFSTSETIIDIYLWHNGTNIIDTIAAENFYFFPAFYFNSLVDIQKIFSLKLYEFEQKQMLPICSSGHGEFLVIDLESFNRDPDNTPIYEVQSWDPKSETFTTRYDNFNIMLDTILKCYELKVFYVSEGLLEMDFDAAWKISKETNPLSKYWMQ